MHAVAAAFVVMATGVFFTRFSAHSVCVAGARSPEVWLLYQHPEHPSHVLHLTHFHSSRSLLGL
jgi:hypothetical protein